MKRLGKFALYVSLTIISIFIATLGVTHTFIKPSNDRNWSSDQFVLAHADINENLITIHNIRNFTYASTTSYTSAYYDKTFDIEKIKNVYYVVEPFSGVPGSAHTFVSFEFENDEYVAISVEIRKEQGESYHPLKGLFNQYELMYVIADERDVIKLRTNYRKDPVYLYPAKASLEKKKLLFLDMVHSANELKDNPEFYNTITNTCTTAIARHINAVSPNRVPLLNLSILLPKSSDKLAYKLGLIDTELSFEDARLRYLINERAEKYADAPDFSVKIRGEN